MLPPPARETTTGFRVVLAILFAFAFPPIGLALSGGLSLPLHVEQTATMLAVLPLMMMLSLIAGWVFVLPACVVWALLHQFDAHHRWVAALVGVLTGLAFASLLNSFDDDQARALATSVTCAWIGLVTGLGVWWVSYGRQKSLPAPIVTRPPLCL
jgi:hypothetical protein